MTETKRYSFNWERGHPNFWDNHCDLAYSYLTCEDVVDRLNELSDENEYYKSIFFELVETALKDENCRELYCKGILDIFNKANSLNQAREMIKEHLE